MAESRLYSLQLWQEGRWVYQPPSIMDAVEYSTSILDGPKLKINGAEPVSPWRIVRDDGLVMASSSSIR